jgi:hypothetical protein
MAINPNYIAFEYITCFTYFFACVEQEEKNASWQNDDNGFVLMGFLFFYSLAYLANI